jgi:hypothetical protein
MRILFLFLVLTNPVFAQFTYSGFIYNADGSGAGNVPVKLYRRTNSTISGFTSQTNYNGHSYYRSTGSATWTTAKSNCESMGGHLATISNSAENNFLFNTWPSGWIGYYQDRVTGYTYSEPAGGFRWTETQVTDGLSADYDVSSYVSGSSLVDLKSSINATLYNSPSYSSTGGKYLAFNGSNQYAITSNLSSKLTGTPISILAWIYPTGNGVILSELNSASTTSGWHESVIEITGSNTLRVGLWNGTGITQISTGISLNTWNLVCLTYDGSTMRGYLNNVSFGSVNFSRQAAVTHSGTGTQHFAFGLQDATNMGHGGYGSFRLGDIQFFNRAITIDEIDRTFNLYAYRYRTNQYNNWNPGEPNNSGNEDYAQFVSGGKWNDLPNTSLPYVIEFDYIVTTSAWSLYKTVYTNNNGYYSISEPYDPSKEYYIQLDLPSLVQPLTNNDAEDVSDLILKVKPTNGVSFYSFDVNFDNKITVSDQFRIFAKKNGLINIWAVPNLRWFTVSEYNTIKNSTSNVRNTIPGVTSVTTSTLISGGSLNYYLIATGYSGKVNY